MSDTPNPGSVEAVAHGCTCPVMDNRRGQGAGQIGEPFPGTVWWINGDCPLHAPQETSDD